MIIKMTKKIYIILTLIWLIFGITKVKALSKNEKINITKESLETIIVTKEEGIWKDLNIERYIKENLTIYKIGNNNLSKNEITVGSSLADDRIKRIIKGKDREKIFYESRITSEKDKYIATKIAIDSISNGYAVSEIKNNYKAKENLSEIVEIRANNIIRASEKLADLGYTGKEKFQNITGLAKMGEFSKDDIKKNYSSQKYKIDAEGVKLTGYRIIEKSDSKINYYIANEKSSEEQETFGENDRAFKIMVPEEEIKDIFNIVLKVELYYEVDRFFNGTDGTIILSRESKSGVMDAELRNKYSKLSLNFVDEETGNNIYGCTAEIQGNIYEINENNQEIRNDILKSDVSIKILDMPDKYYVENEEYIIELNHQKHYIENVILKRKKGNLEITTEAGNATYEIYDDKQKQIGTYETNEEGKVYIENIEIGNYTIKQIKVKEGYKLANDNIIPILHGETCYVTIINEEEEIDSEETELPKEDDKEDEEEVIPPKEDEKTEIPDNKEEKPDIIEKPKEDKEPEQVEKPKQEETEKEQEETEEKQEETNISKDEKEIIDILTQETNKPNISNKKVEEKIEKLTLPRTGNDYFIFKILLADIIIFLLIVFLSNLYSNKNKTRLSKEQVTKKI